MKDIKSKTLARNSFRNAFYRTCQAFGQGKVLTKTSISHQSVICEVAPKQNRIQLLREESKEISDNKVGDRIECKFIMFALFMQFSGLCVCTLQGIKRIKANLLPVSSNHFWSNHSWFLGHNQAYALYSNVNTTYRLNWKIVRSYFDWKVGCPLRIKIAINGIKGTTW